MKLYHIVDWTGKKLFKKEFEGFEAAWEFIDSLDADFKIENNLGYYEPDGVDFINEMWVIPTNKDLKKHNPYIEACNMNQIFLKEDMIQCNSN